MPSGQLTRGDFLVMLMRAYDIAPNNASEDNFSDAGNNYQTGYLAAAKRLGLAKGVGDNLFAPNRSITRQEMFVLIHGTLDALGMLDTMMAGALPADTTDPAMGIISPVTAPYNTPAVTFSDGAQIQPWAVEAVDTLTRAGLVKGSDGVLNPASQATRAEMAQMLFNLLQTVP
jgi:hypothetical protein